MPGHHHSSDDDDEPLDDKTAAIVLHSKRTERMQRKKATRDKKRDAIINLAKLPTELILGVLKLLRPSDVINFALVNRRFHSLMAANASVIGDDNISQRYAILAQCFPLPRLLSSIESDTAALLSAPARQELLAIHKKPYAHVQPPNPHLVCTCITCVLAWNNLGLALDFARWQDNLDKGEPVPMIPRGQKAEWNEELIARNASIARKALANSLWYARILEAHLDSTTRSIRRHALNKGNKRKHVQMTEEEAAKQTDQFLDKSGPSSIEFPFHRDNYYLLEAYLPNRWWKTFEQRWVYIAGRHEQDVEWVVRTACNKEATRQDPSRTCQQSEPAEPTITDRCGPIGEKLASLSVH